MSPTIGIVGYGRFGAALSELVMEQGHKVVAFDAHTEVSDPLKTSSLEDLAKTSSVIILCVPVRAIEASLRTLRPYLNPNQLIMDVGSVKTGPSALMQEILGQDIPWTATHPLFGPTSIALGERPLGVVVCPNLQHPEAATKAQAFYEELGCQVRIQNAEEHDEEMAHSHALAYFVAKGFLDSGVVLDSPNAPPSAKAIHRTVEAVREDAAHLFATLHRENPYAKDARRRLLDALTKVDAVLNQPAVAGEEAHQEKGLLQFEEAAYVPPQLQEARDVIDTIDEKILRLLAQRAALSLRASKAKEEVGRAVRDPKRERELLHRRSEIAGNLDLDSEAVSEIFDAILRFSRRHQVKARSETASTDEA